MSAAGGEADVVRSSRTSLYGQNRVIRAADTYLGFPTEADEANSGGDGSAIT